MFAFILKPVSFVLFKNACWMCAWPSSSHECSAPINSLRYLSTYLSITSVYSIFSRFLFTKAMIRVEISLWRRGLTSVLCTFAAVQRLLAFASLYHISLKITIPAREGDFIASEIKSLWNSKSVSSLQMEQLHMTEQNKNKKNGQKIFEREGRLAALSVQSKGDVTQALNSLVSPWKERQRTREYQKLRPRKKKNNPIKEVKNC